MSAALLPLKILLVAIDLMISMLTFGWIKVLKKMMEKEPLRSVPVADDESHRVKTGYKGKLVRTPGPGLDTLYAVVKSSFEKYAEMPCMKKRQFLGMKSAKVKEFGPDVTTYTYKEVGAIVHKFGAALRAAGCVPSPPTTDLEKVTTPCRMAIFENTCPEWFMAALGATTQSISIVTVYATLGLDAVVEAINENIIPVIVCNKANVKNLVDKKKNMPSLKAIVYTNDLVGPNDTTELPPAPQGVAIMSFDEFVASGDTKAYPPTPPTPTSTSTVMYTSGSTGKPKGVVIKQESIVGNIASAALLFNITSADNYLAYLPAAHIMEFMVEFTVLAFGGTLSFADPKSLTQTGSYPVGALEQYKPTLMVAVPKIWDTIKKGLLAKVAKSSPVAQGLVYTALEWRAFATKYGLDTPLFNAIVFKKFKAAVGGNLRWAISGGGPLNGEVQDFIRTAFGFPLVQGYGLTETCAGLTIQADEDMRQGVQGVPIPSMEVKLVSTPDVMDKAGLPYLSTDRKDVNGDPVFGRGEIWCLGVNVTSGYYMQTEKSKEEFKEDGWFATGDIGQFRTDGSLSIVDRKKNLVKLKGGEYVALEKMEMTYGNSDFVDAVSGGICCYGDGDMDRPVALMQVNEAYAMKWAEENGIKGDIETLKSNKTFMAAVMESMRKEHAKSDLSHLEKLAAVSLLTSPWTPENGCLTAANKLQRRVVVEMFVKEFEQVKDQGIFK